MDAGALKHMIVIEAPTVTQDSVGGQVTTWATLVTVRASLQPIRGREFFESQRIDSELTMKVTTRYVPGIVVEPEQRVVFGTRIFDIRRVMNVDERNEVLELMCTEILESSGVN